MRMRTLSSGSGIVVMLVAILLACDKSPTEPTKIEQPSRQPPPASTPKVFTGLTITGPGTIAPEQVGQFTARAQYSDSSTEDVTNTATWRTTRSDVLTISSTGQATAHGLGESGITASYSSRIATKGDIIVVPEGTFRVSG